MENSEHDDYQSDKELKFYLRTFVFHSLPLLGMAGSIGGFVIEPEEKKYQGIYEGTKVQIFGRNFYTWLSFDSRSPILQIKKISSVNDHFILHLMNDKVLTHE